QRVVTPVVAETLFNQRTVLQERLDRHQLDRRNAEAVEAVDHFWMPKGCKGATPGRLYILKEMGEAADMGVGDDGFGPARGGACVILPGEVIVCYDALGHRSCAVAPVDAEIGARRVDAVTEQRIGPAQRAEDFLRIRIEQQFRRIEPMTLLRIVRTVRAVA